MRPYDDANEARIDRQAEQAQEAYDALYAATRAKWAAEYRAEFSAQFRKKLPFREHGIHEHVVAELARIKSTNGE